MNRFSALVLTVVALTFAIGCGGSGNKLGLKAGDKLVATEKIDRVKFEASYGTDAKNPDDTDGDLTEIPEGTVLEVFVTPREGAGTIEVKPVKSGDVTDIDQLKALFVPARFLRDNFLDYSIIINVKDFGTKVKKAE